MILYEVIERQINALHCISNMEGLPMEISLNHRILWLGDINTELFPVQVRKDKMNLGWLYEDISIILFRMDNGILFECSVNQLKELAQGKLAAKRIVSEPELNAMTKAVTGEVIGYLELSDVLNISHIIETMK